MFPPQAHDSAKYGKLKINVSFICFMSNHKGASSIFGDERLKFFIVVDVIHFLENSDVCGVYMEVRSTYCIPFFERPTAFVNDTY
jgi:hypothetical protein